jgi:DNA-binding transcriptional MerR regulator
MSETWTIGELAERAAAVLRGGTGPGTADGRIRAVPTERLIRWYTTIGLVDPPLARRGRVALYGRRHLLQLVAIKRRQAEGRSIAEIQAELAGATDATLAEIARIPPPAAAPAAPPPVPPSAAVPGAPDDRAAGAAGQAPDGAPYGPAARRDRFWTRRSPAPAGPAAAEPGAARAAATGDAPADGVAIATAPAPLPPAPPLPGAVQARRAGTPAPEPVSGLRLAPGVTLLLDAAPRPPDAADLAAIAAAARPLLDVLLARGLTGPADPGGRAEGSPPWPGA